MCYADKRIRLYFQSQTCNNVEQKQNELLQACCTTFYSRHVSLVKPTQHITLGKIDQVRPIDPAVQNNVTGRQVLQV